MLISIPDIETHIQNELSRSPSPTSRHVGIPLPTKSRAGVSIPDGQQRARRQVQIFDSQPLASPSRSVDKLRNRHTSLSLSARHSNSGSWGNNAHGSYVAQMHLSKLTVPKRLIDVSSWRSFARQQTRFPLRFQADCCLLSKAHIRFNVIVVIIGSIHPGVHHHWLKQQCWSVAKQSDDDIEGLPVPVNKRKEKGKMAVEDQLDDTLSTSWRDSLGIQGSWKDKLSPRQVWTFASAKQRSFEQRPSTHLLYRFWNDPGTAAPAPAVVVSAVVGADGEEGAGNYFDLANGVARSSSTSEFSSGTAQPSRNGSPNTADQTSSKKIILTSSISEVPSTDSPAAVPQPSSTTSSLSSSSNVTPSLLMQTAPPRPLIPPSLPSPSSHLQDIRPSPSHHVFTTFNTT
ncbi:hypothetical protein L208DRAFT_1458739 [Tricholoma matsutake]|nr:hypothetical protein L208DRAFT_1458739 [Tricholoma matsutake 945]